MNPQRGHLSVEMAQAFLDGRASDEDARTVQEHVGACVGCEAAFEAWKSVYARLGHLTELQPSTGFAASVMERFLGEAQEAAAPFDERGHLTTDLLLEYLDGQLTGPGAQAAQAHLAACSDCTAQHAEWSTVFGSIAEIGHLEPTEGFQNSVLAAAHIATPAYKVLPIRIRAATAARGWIGKAVARVRQRDRKSLAILAGLGTAPAVVVATLGWVVLTHPLVTTSGLLRFAVLKVGQLADGVASMVLGGAGDSALLFALSSGLEIVANAPGAAALGALAVLALMSVSTWVLFRNLGPVRGTMTHARIGRVGALRG